MDTEPQRLDGWVVTYHLDVCFDTDNDRTRYDHVGTLARCNHCNEIIHPARSGDALVGHARTHEADLSLDHSPEAARHTVAVAGKEVIAKA
jgi:ribosomal protein S27E